MKKKLKKISLTMDAELFEEVQSFCKNNQVVLNARTVHLWKEHMKEKNPSNRKKEGEKTLKV